MISLTAQVPTDDELEQDARRSRSNSRFCESGTRRRGARCSLSSRAVDCEKGMMKQKIRRAGNALGAREAKLAAASLGNPITHDQAVAWVNGAIDRRSGELRVAGASAKDIEAWDWACRIMFMLKVRPLSIK
jgi:hypothetical protein